MIPSNGPEQPRQPATVESLRRDLSALDVRAGSVLMVHASLSRLGWVCGGPLAVVQALRNSVGPEGTLVMPAHSGDLSDPASWSKPPVPSNWYATIRAHTPAFDPLLTPTRRMGAIAESFRHWPGATRSHHPTGSFAALGPHAAWITDGQPLTDPFGELSPLARLEHLGAQILLLGVDHGRNTSLHLAERRAFGAAQRQRSNGSPLLVQGQRQWVEYSQPDHDDSDFAELGEEFEHAWPDAHRRGTVGVGEARLVKLEPLLAFALPWLIRHRDAELPAPSS